MAKNKNKEKFKIKAFLKKQENNFKKIPNHFFFLFSAGFCFLVFLGIVCSFFFPKNNLEKAKADLLRENPLNDSFSTLALSLLKSNSFEQAEKLIVLAEKKKIEKEEIEKIKLYKQEIDPKEIKKQINYWENIIIEKKDYRDAYLKLATFYYRLENFQKTKENLEKAKNLDPNYILTKDFLKKLEN
jgi:tetratricopeptide (TPR) repeat protein